MGPSGLLVCVEAGVRLAKIGVRVAVCNFAYFRAAHFAKRLSLVCFGRRSKSFGLVFHDSFSGVWLLGLTESRPCALK